MNSKHANTNQTKANKKLRQLSIVSYLEKESQKLFSEKHFSSPTKKCSKVEGHLTPLSPIDTMNKDNIVYTSPVVNLNAVNKDKDFYSLEEFTQDMNTVTFKKALFKASEKFHLLKERTDVLKYENSGDIAHSQSNEQRSNIISPKLCIDFRLDNSTTSGYHEISKTTNQFGSTENLEITKLLQDRSKQQQSLRVKRQPNEIFTASQVFPVLIRDLPKQNLREELDYLGITKPLSSDKRNSFLHRLESFGEELVDEYLENAASNVKSKDVKFCFYCGFQTESSLVMGSHLDRKHEKRFQKWPFSSRMDFKCNE